MKVAFNCYINVTDFKNNANLFSLMIRNPDSSSLFEKSTENRLLCSQGMEDYIYVFVGVRGANKEVVILNG